MPQSPRDTPSAHWIAPTLLLLGNICFVLAWILLAIYLQDQSSWLAVFGAIASALLLRLGGMRAGSSRAALAVGSTAGMILLFNWAMIATQIGMIMGLNPLDSALKLGMHHASTLAGLANSGADLAWMALALVLAWLLAR